MAASMFLPGYGSITEGPGGALLEQGGDQKPSVCWSQFQKEWKSVVRGCWVGLSHSRGAEFSSAHMLLPA